MRAGCDGSFFLGCSGSLRRGVTGVSLPGAGVVDLGLGSEGWEGRGSFTVGFWAGLIGGVSWIRGLSWRLSLPLVAESFRPGIRSWTAGSSLDLDRSFFARGGRFSGGLTRPRICSRKALSCAGEPALLQPRSTWTWSSRRETLLGDAKARFANGAAKTLSESPDSRDRRRSAVGWWSS